MVCATHLGLVRSLSPHRGELREQKCRREFAGQVRGYWEVGLLGELNDTLLNGVFDEIAAIVHS